MLLLVITTAGMAGSSGKDLQKSLDKVNYIAYQGQQQAWPIGTGLPKSLETKYGVTIFRSLPSKAYEILGLIQIAHGKVAKRVSEAAQAAGANGILVCADEAFVKAGITIQPSLVIDGDSASDISSLTGFLIRWKLIAYVPSAPPTNAPAVQPAAAP